MKKHISFFLAAATMSLTLASCSQEELSTGGDVITPDMETSYAKVKISMGNPFGSRAAFNEDQFDKGTKDEAAVKSLTLMFYDDLGTLVGSGSTNGFTTPDDRDGNVNVSDMYETVVKVNLFPGAQKPTKMLAFVNSDAHGSYVEAELETKLAAEIGNTTDGFVMTNSGYYKDDNSWTIATEVNENNLYDTAEEAKEGNAITVYVERLAAKVQVLKGIGLTDDYAPDAVIRDLQDNAVTIKFTPKKWSVTATAKDMYTLKHAFSTTLNNWANSSKNNRSYWAEGTNYKTAFGSYKTTSSTPLDYLSLSQIVSTNGGVGYELGKGVQYVTEHTYGKALEANDFSPVLASTSLVVVGQYSVEGDNADKYKVDDTDNYQFYLTLNGSEGGKNVYTIYSEKEMVAELVKRAGLTLSSSSDSQVALEDLTDYFTISYDKVNDFVKLNYKGEGLYYQDSDQAWQALGSDQLANATKYARMYKKGWTYFWSPIMHNQGVEDKGEGYYGIVRNHSYQITINSFGGIGAPMDKEVSTGNGDDDDPDPDPEDQDPDPSNPIIPDPDDMKDAYINATLNVLSWHNVNYTVNF